MFYFFHLINQISYIFDRLSFSAVPKWLLAYTTSTNFTRTVLNSFTNSIGHDVGLPKMIILPVFKGDFLITTFFATVFPLLFRVWHWFLAPCFALTKNQFFCSDLIDLLLEKSTIFSLLSYWFIAQSVCYFLALVHPLIFRHLWLLNVGHFLDYLMFACIFQFDWLIDRHFWLLIASLIYLDNLVLDCGFQLSQLIVWHFQLLIASFFFPNNLMFACMSQVGRLIHCHF